MKKRVLSSLLAVVIVLGAIPLALLSIVANALDSGSGDTDSGAPVISIEPTTKHISNKNDSPAKPDASGYAHFIIKATGTLTEDVTVYYATQDMSAVASAGDYNAVSDSVILTNENSEVQISVQTARTEYSVKLNTKSHAGDSAYKYFSRSFLVKLTAVEGNAVIDTERSEVECALLAEHNLDAYSSASSAMVMKPYSGQNDFTLLNFLKTEPCDGGESTYQKAKSNFPANWSSDYVNSDIGAHLYMALNNAHVDESWWNSTTSMTVVVAGVTVDIRGEFHDNAEFGWGPALIYGIYDEEGNSDEFKKYYNNNYISTFWKTYDGTSKTITNDKDYMASLLEENFIIRRDRYATEPDRFSLDPSVYFIALSDEVLGWTAIELTLKSDGGYSRQLVSGDVIFRLEDVTAPVLETDVNGNYEILHNFNTVTKGEKLRVALRFNEPVQINGKEPYFTGKVNGIGSGVEPHPYAIKFSYAGGSGSDTLYFEADYKGDYHITSITDIQFRHSNSIMDFAGCPNIFTPDANLILDGFNLDKRTPTLSVSSNDSKLTEWGKSKTVSVTVSNISENALLYYAWTDSTTPPETFSNRVTVSNVSVNGSSTVTISGDGTGEKYLHMQAVSRYGVTQTRILVVGNTTVSQPHLGVYRFDNTGPTVDETKLLPATAGSNTFQKNYTIPCPSDVGSGFKEIKMYYVGEDGKDYPIENKCYNVSSFKNSGGAYHDVQFTLDAAEVGVGDNTRREVTIFYTLTDALGNTVDNVGRHTVLFDTNIYIEIGAAYPFDSFLADTEIIDDGYTFIYKGNPEITYTSSYYTFFIKTATEHLGGTTVISITKNGGEISESEYNATRVDTLEDGVQTTLIAVDFIKPMSTGYYDIQLKGYDTGSTDDEPDRVSKPYRIYVGSGNGKLDAEVNQGTVLINKIYQLPANFYFYHMTTSGTIANVSREFYNGTSLPASFSSREKALEYVLFNEYRDLYAITLTAELADALNAGNSNVQKAYGESTVAREGQVWIRYKSAEWDVNSPLDKTKWVFYYYGATEELEVAYFSKTLQNALTTVSNNIVARIKNVSLPNLSSYAGESLASLENKLGPPTLALEQVHSQDKYLSAENCNSIFSTNVRYQGDTAIYSSEVMINGVEYVLMGNVVIPMGPRLQYKRIDENGTEDEAWTELVFINGQRFGDVLTDTGRYKIRELGNGGVSVFNVYIDKDAPMVLVTWMGKDATSSSQILNQHSEKDFRAKSFKIIGIDSREYDKYSYVAIYKISGFELYGVYTLAELQKSSVAVADGDYYMVISDRSGNSYIMTLHVNSSSLKCEIKESENVKIKFTCDRKISQIQEFYVKRNGVLLSGKYAPELEFTESGVYEFYVRDIYGNVFGPEFYEFERVYPEVEWKYKDESGHYVSYDENNKTKQFSLERVADGTFAISTSVGMKFKLTGDYGYTFIGVAPEYEESIKDGTVTIKSTQMFQLKVYYKKHPEVYTIYNCSADTTAPVIEVSVEVDNPVPDEIEALRQALEAGLTPDSDGRLIPGTISYSSTGTTTRYLSNNDTVLSDLIRVNITDEIGLSYVCIYLNGKLIKEQSGEMVDTDIVLSKSGTYSIVTEDKLGNRSEFNFTNGTVGCFDYLVDSMPYTIGLHDFENFDENGNYTDIIYGNSELQFVIRKQMKIFCMFTDSKGEKHFVAFEVADKMIREIYYSLDSDNNVVLTMSDNILFDGTDPKIVKDKNYVFYEVENTGIKIYASQNHNGSISLYVYAKDETPVCIEARLNTDDDEFYYTKIELSNFAAQLDIQTESGNLSIFEGNEMIKLNCPFKILAYKFEANKIEFAEVYYSNINDFADYGYFFKEDIYEEDRIFDQEGFYYVRIGNKYGNVSEFTVHISYKFDVSSYADLADGERIYYTTNYDDTIYSNNKIVFELYALGVNINVTRNGEPYEPIINIASGMTYVILSDDGDYTVTMSDAYRNKVERSAKIDSSLASFNEGLLTGYNENALKKGEGYTNQKLSINKTLFDEMLISYLEIQYGDISDVLYDAISENTITLDEARLLDCIGSYGDGVYTVIMRNRYGALITKVIHYRATPTLILERETRSGTETERYDMDLALSIGFWSNSELIFRTDAITYVFTINGDKTECPKTLSFTDSEQGRSEYVITYIDEYGFSYSFKAYLVRQAIEITPELSTEGQYINGVLTTTEDIVINFSESASCTYTWNNSEERVYTSGEKLIRDGVYRFVAVDHAGNLTAFTIKKDTTVEFEFINDNSSTQLQSGGVVNSAKVSFDALNGDSAYIERVYKNGVAQKDYNSTKFTEDGKWEIIVSDKLGNKSYFCFYIINKQKDSFAYTTPYEYRITELWYDSGDGVELSYLKFVDHSDYYSSFDFNENGTYRVVMTSTVTGTVSEFEFTINTVAPDVSLVGCNVGETTINDVTVSGCTVGDRVKVYKSTRTGEKLVSEIEVTSTLTKMPTITEGGEYRIVVESEAGVATELTFVRKHVMNTEGSIFIMVMIGVAVVGLFTGLVYRNKSKTDN